MPGPGRGAPDGCSEAVGGGGPRSKYSGLGRLGTPNPAAPPARFSVRCLLLGRGMKISSPKAHHEDHHDSEPLGSRPGGVFFEQAPEGDSIERPDQKVDDRTVDNLGCSSPGQVPQRRP